MQTQPSVADGIRTVIKVEVRGNKAAKPDFRMSMSRSFVSVGLKKDPVTDKYVTFSHSKCGTISTLHREVKQLEDTVDKPNFCVGDEAMQFDTTQRPKDPDEEEEDVLAAAAEESESDSDQDDE